MRWTRLFVVVALGLSISLVGAGSARADSWQDRVSLGSAYAANRGTTVEIAMVDRATGGYRDNGKAAHTRIESASVMKVFIAENLLHRRDLGQIRLSASDLTDMSRMLRESYDVAANRFWSGYGANSIVSDVIKRYGLTETGLTSNIRYWGNTMITGHDMVVFYQRLMDGSGGLSTSSRDWILDQMRHSTEQGDGGRQFFGLHDGLPSEQVIAQKQGWMCCVSGNIYRHSTGFVGPDSRYVVVVLTREPSSRGTAHIETSISSAIATMFPERLIPRVQGDIGELWYRMGGTNSLLGYPVSDELALTGGALSRFQGGFIYWSPTTGAHWVTGDILREYGDLTWERGVLGYPTSDEIKLIGGALSRFQGGFVYWSPSTRAHAVVGSILGKYGDLGWERGALGYPTSDEIKLTGGAVSRFQGGAVYWSPKTGAHNVWGSILTAYGTTGAERGPLGYPTSDEAPAAGGGAANRFQGGSMYWTKTTGAHWVGGALFTAYVAQGSERGALGYPTSNPREVTGGTVVDFQHGSMTLTSAGEVVMRSDSAATATPAPSTPAANKPAPSAPTSQPPTRTATTTSTATPSKPVASTSVPSTPVPSTPASSSAAATSAPAAATGVVDAP